MYVLRLKLNPNTMQRQFLNKSFFIAYKMYVILVKYVQKQIRLLSKNKRYVYLKHMYGVYTKENNKIKLKEVKNEMNQIIRDLHISRYDLEDFITPMQHKYKKYITSHQAQKITRFVYDAVDDYLYGNGKKIKIKKFVDFNTISQKNTTNGIKFKDSYIEFMKYNIPVKYSNNAKDQMYILESMNHKLKYCELIKIEFNSGVDYYVKLVLDGDAPSKIQKGKDTCGIDPGVSTMAYTSDTKCILEELAPKCKDYNKQIAKLQKQIDKSIRATNPNKFNDDGTYKKGNKEKFVYTKHCKHLKRKLRVLYRQKSAYTECMHNNLINRMLNGVCKVNIESMDYKALAKKTKSTEKSTKTISIKQKDGTIKEINKFKRKKRFGKSINDRSPGLFIKLLETRCNRYNINFNKINTKKVKASKYNHLTGSYEEHKLSERTKLIGSSLVQRDLYSSYIIKNVKKDLESLNKSKLKKDFPLFLELEEIEIKRIKAQGIKNKNFGF